MARRARILAIVIVMGLSGLLAAQQPGAGPAITPAQAANQAAVQAGLQLYQANCTTCHGANGNSVNGVDFRTGRFTHGTTDDDLVRIIGSGIQGTAMSGTTLSENLRRSLVAYIRSMSAAAPAAPPMSEAAIHGQALFEGKGNCLSCHRVNGKGSHVAPDLSAAALGGRGARGGRGGPAVDPSAELLRSITEPDATLTTANRFIVAVMKKDGKTVTGRRLNEDTDSIQIMDAQDRLVALSKSDLREYKLLSTSTMPSYQGELTPQELSDIVAYLLTLRGAAR